MTYHILTRATKRKSYKYTCEMREDTKQASRQQQSNMSPRLLLFYAPVLKLSMIFQLLIKDRMIKYTDFLALNLSDAQ